MTKVLLLLSLLSLPLLAAEILVISSYHQSNQWDQSYSAGLEKHLKQAHHLGYLYLDTKRQPGQTRDELLAKGMAAYRTHQPALVILGMTTPSTPSPDPSPPGERPWCFSG